MMKKKILIVDASQRAQTSASPVLSKIYDVITASSGEEAIQLYEQERPDLILTDLSIPNMSGFELQRILQQKHKELIPIMFMSADENEENEIKGLEGGALDYIRKPFKEEVLLRRVENIMRHVERIKSLQVAAETDPMTGLYNKTYARRALTELCLHANGMLMMIDLDNFKLVNDLYGHAMGDRVLIRFAEILKGVIRGTDIAGRVGGDEFLIFCQDVREESTVAEKTRQINNLLLESAQEYMGTPLNIPLGVSVGAVSVPHEGRDFAELYQKADRAMYSVKQSGKHGYSIFHSDAAHTEVEWASESGSLYQFYHIMEERNRQPGAFKLTFDRFQTIFRYLVRMVENYHTPAQLALFTLAPADPARNREKPPSDVVRRFGDNLRTSLRRSDAYTQTGNGQFLVIFSESDGSNEEVIIQRILRNWEQNPDAHSVSISYETRVIQP